jgi:ribosome recycling factor
MEEILMYIDLSKESMDGAIKHLEHELQKIRTGKASPAMLNGIQVEYYGVPSPLSQVASVATADARTITIQPWEKKMLAPIERAIFEANLGITPQNDGEIIRLMIPPLTEERRKDLAKKAKALGEESKVGVRAARRDVMEEIKKAVKNGFSEDAGKSKEAIVQDMTNKYIDRVDRMIATKEQEIFTI